MLSCYAALQLRHRDAPVVHDGAVEEIPSLLKPLSSYGTHDRTVRLYEKILGLAVKLRKRRYHPEEVRGYPKGRDPLLIPYWNSYRDDMILTLRDSSCHRGLTVCGTLCRVRIPGGTRDIRRRSGGVCSFTACIYDISL